MDVGGADAVIIVGGLAMSGAVGELVKIFFAKMRSADYVDKASCKACKKQEIEVGQGQKNKIDAIARLVMAMAIKMGVETDEIAKLL